MGWSSFLGTYDSLYAFAETQRVEIGGTQGRVVMTNTVQSFEFQAAGSEVAER